MAQEVQRPDIAEREIRVKERELDLKVQEAGKAAWRSPLVLSILAAALAALSNAGIAYYNAEVDRQRQLHAAENARILQMLNVEPEQAARNLDFLLQTGLITDPKLRAALSDYLAAREPGTGPSLVASTFAEALAADIDDGVITILSGEGVAPDDQTVIRLSVGFLFEPGRARITRREAAAALDRVAAAANDFIQSLPAAERGGVSVTVVGHTDNLPMVSLKFPDNQALSVARARAVATALAPLLPTVENIGAEGRGDLEPIADNDTPEGRSRNRRIEIVIHR
ncbi:MAG: OmpA family protein [Pseudomonadota bacterium]